jgi:hypothetical protein
MHEITSDHFVEARAPDILEAASSYVAYVEAWDQARRVCRVTRKQLPLRRTMLVLWPLLYAR